MNSKPVIPYESAEQAAVIQWWGLQYPDYDILLFAIPNGGLRNKVTAAKLKKEGVKPGVADLFLCLPNGIYHGLFIEMKREKGGRQADSQKAFQAAVEEQGYCYVVACGFKEAVLRIKDYLKKKRTAPTKAAEADRRIGGA